jgi:cellulose synthase operon protein C
MRAAYLAPLWLLALAGCVSPFRVPELDPTDDIGETVGKRRAPDPAVLPIISSEPVAADPDKAIENYRKLLELEADKSTREEAQRRLADLQVQQADAQGNTADSEQTLRESVALYRRLLAENPGDAANDRLYYQLARAQQNLGDTDTAIETLATLTAEHPESRLSGDARFRRAELLFFEERFAESEAEYARVMALNDATPFFDIAQYKFGWSRYKQGNYDGAITVFLDILNRELPENEWFETEAAFARVAGAKVDYARDSLRVISLSFANLGGGEAVNDYFARNGEPSYFPLIYVALGDTLLERERYTDAAETSAAFIARHARHPRAPDFQSRVIAAYRAGGFNDLVVREKERYVASYDPGADYWGGARASEKVLGELRIHLDDLANHYYAKGQLDEVANRADFLTAAGYYRRILEVYPQDGQVTEINFMLGESLFNGGRTLEAAEEYARTAYDYPRHLRSAESAYASVLAYQRHADEQSAEARPAALELAISAGLRYADTYPGHGQVLPALTRSAENLFELKRYDSAIEVAARVLAHPGNVDYRLRRNAWGVTANSHFAQGRFAEAEPAFVEELKLVSPRASERPEIVERLAASVYRQGEAAREGGELRQAVFHFLRVKTVAPGASILATADYDGASVLFELEDWPQAAREIEAFRSAYPSDALIPDADKMLAVAYQRDAQPFKSAQVYRRITERPSESAEIRQEAAWLAAQLYDEAGAAAETATAYAQYLQAWPRPVARGMTARSRLVELAEARGDRAEQQRWLRDILSADASAGSERSDATRLLAAESALTLGKLLAAETRELALSLPLERSLPVRRQSMESAIHALTQAAGYGFAEVTTAATYELGRVYQAFAAALMTSERPRNLDALALEQYELLLEEQAFPFEERAIDTFAANLKRIEQGLYDDAIRESYRQLAIMAPAQYGRVERGERIYEAFH